jgi:uncharacterized protein YejL (UPF0352 family)
VKIKRDREAEFLADLKALLKKHKACIKIDTIVYCENMQSSAICAILDKAVHITLGRSLS